VAIARGGESANRRIVESAELAYWVERVERVASAPPREPGRVKRAAFMLFLRAVQRIDRWRLRRLMRRHPGVYIHPTASSNLASARFTLGEGARLWIGPHTHTERRADGVRFEVGDGAELVLEGTTWLRSVLQPIHFAVFEGARMTIGDGSWLNGCHLNAKASLEVGQGAMIGPGVRIFDADQHPLDAERPEVIGAVRIGECVWIASDATILRGVELGSHSIVAARSVVTRSLPPHCLAVGAPAESKGKVGDRQALMDEWRRDFLDSVGS
jgi:carbonic anhydrase/acetyltransferase-like protein (isoleucine patch superfamily)